MTLAASDSIPAGPTAGWTLHVHTELGCCGTLAFVFEDGTRFNVDLPPSLSSFLLALIASRELDLRNAVLYKIGCRRLSTIGRIVRRMPGPGNPVSENAIGGYKRALIRHVRLALEKKSLKLGRKLNAPLPVLNPAYSQGYCLLREGVAVTGVSIEDLLSLL